VHSHPSTSSQVNASSHWQRLVPRLLERSLHTRPLLLRQRNEQASKMQSVIKFIVKSQAPSSKSVPHTAKHLDKYFFNSCKVPTLSTYATSFLPTIRSSIVAKSSLGWNKSSLSQFVPFTRYDACLLFLPVSIFRANVLLANSAASVLIPAVGLDASTPAIACMPT
jgi:hypothetical protein